MTTRWSARIRSKLSAVVVVFALCAMPLRVRAAGEPLPSWNDGAAKTAILDFVRKTTTQGSPDFVAPEERIAAFDQDGTLWVEQPIYTQVLYCLDRVPAVVKAKPELAKVEPFKTVVSGNREAIGKLSKDDLLKIVGATLTGMTVDVFAKEAEDWLSKAVEPRWKKPYTALIYQPMTEVMQYLRDNGYRTYIVTGGGQDFVRVYAERVYGIPPEQVIGSSGVVKFEMPQPDKPVLMKEPKVEFIDDGPGKPVGINRFIGRRPVLAFGNSDGDQQMLEWTAAGPGARFMGIVHHPDAEREYAYDRQSKMGRLDKAFDDSPSKGWTVVDMKRDWNAIYPFQLK